jgi:hypothetical protein
MTNELTTVQQVMKRWKMHHNALLELVAVLPDSSGSWRPWEEGMTVTELVHHLAWTPDFLVLRETPLENWAQAGTVATDPDFQTKSRITQVQD